MRFLFFLVFLSFFSLEAVSSLLINGKLPYVDKDTELIIISSLPMSKPLVRTNENSVVIFVGDTCMTPNKFDLIITKKNNSYFYNTPVIRVLDYSKESTDEAIMWLKRDLDLFNLNEAEANKIAQKIWDNESHSNDKLAFWNKSESFPSMGIGHFIWPPKSYKGSFENGRFHLVLDFIKEKGIELPRSLKEYRYCLYETREEFYENYNSQEMKEIREFLKNTFSLQALYFLKRLSEAYILILEDVKPQIREKVSMNFFSLSRTPQGLFALVDYLNFKHEGIDPKECYKGEGWGLKQVLEEMDCSHEPLQSFVKSCKKRLLLRIQNANNPEFESRWKKGWFRRLDNYLCG